MTIFLSILFSALALLTSVFRCEADAHQTSKHSPDQLTERKFLAHQEMGTIFVTTSVIKKGEIIRQSMVKSKRLRASDIPNFAIGLKKFVIGKRVAYKLVAGQTILTSDLDPYPDGDLVPYVFTKKEIRAGDIIKKNDVELLNFEFFTAYDQSEPRPKDCAAVVGKKARIKLPKNHRLTNDDLVP